MKAKEMRIVFMGTPGFAVGVLEALIAASYRVVAVITAPDKPAGRGKKLRASAVKKYALEQHLPVLQPTNLKAESFLEELAAFRPDIQVVVAFRMLPEAVWKLPPLGTFNLHASLLPAYRGAAPINWAIMKGERETGVTTFFIDEKIDTGAIILQKKVGIASCETAGIIHDRLMQKGSDLVLQTLELIASSNYKTVLQTDQKASYAPKLDKEIQKIDWRDSLKDIYNKIRGLSPYPAAMIQIQSGDKSYVMKLFQVFPDYISHHEKEGSILVRKDSLKIAHKDGFLYIHELQLSGKKRMLIKDFLNGFRFSADSHVVSPW